MKEKIWKKLLVHNQNINFEGKFKILFLVRFSTDNQLVCVCLKRYVKRILDL